MAVMDLSRADNGGASVVTAAVPSVAIVGLTRKDHGMTNRLLRTLASAAMAASLIGALATPAQAAPPPKATEAGFWSNVCEYGHACIRGVGSQSWWNLDGCGWHDVYILPVWGKAHGNSFSVFYRNNLWDDVLAWTDRPLDYTTETTGAWVPC
jgi:hypothetical protein